MFVSQERERLEQERRRQQELEKQLEKQRELERQREEERRKEIERREVRRREGEEKMITMYLHFNLRVTVDLTFSCCRCVITSAADNL